jgi:NDP-sugar pyrophosphorylase family protein
MNMNKRTLLIPAAGSATRMRGLPKFLLPTQDNNTSLLERHLNFLGELFDEILIGINPDFSHLLKSVVDESLTIRIFELRTLTMMETVAKLSEKSVSESFFLIMPDTYFSNYKEILEFLNSDDQNDANLFCWKLQPFQKGKLGQVSIDENDSITDIKDKNLECTYEYFWGAACFSKENLKTVDDSETHVGFMYEKLLARKVEIGAIKVQGLYYDCGTQGEYIQMLRDLGDSR